MKSDGGSQQRSFIKIDNETLKLFSLVVKHLWHKYPELVVPGWVRCDNFGWHLWKNGLPTYTASASTDQILAAAALCAKSNYHIPDEVIEYVDGTWKRFLIYEGQYVSSHESWEAANFAQILTNKGLEYKI